ncbi:MAG: hypothetical protein GX033_01700 [Firmicutes bacterium]|nr:hypothetical protein [Bacillota bacterium]
MSSLLSLWSKRVWCFRFVHLLVAGLVAAVVVAALLFQGYVGAIGEDFAGRLVVPQFPGAAAVFAPGSVEPPSQITTPPNLQLSLLDVTTRHGNVRLAAVIFSNGSGWPMPQGNEAWLPASLRGQVFDEEIGDRIILTHFGGRPWKQAEVVVAGYYEDVQLLSPILVSLPWAYNWLGNDLAYSQTVLVYPEAALKQLQRNFHRIPNAEMVRLDAAFLGVKYLVRNMFAGGDLALFLGIVFLAIGISIFGLLVFIDSRSEIAILKTLGLKPGEVSRLLLMEFGFSTLLGVGLGWGAISVLQRYITFPFKYDWTLLRHGILLVVFAYTIALFAPARLARVATVNELLLKRPILLFTQVITNIEGQRPALHDLISRGWTCLKLESDGNDFLGTVVPRVGSYVRKGELVGWQPTWFGMGEKRYIAPHDGIVQVVDGKRGVVAIAPDQE